ncbi:MAG: hypothetical protein HY943_21090 [Gammaproteobacteria bacterium]|nr:hypothetical protein [Gammaproteobacteria bacterium]
MHTDVAQEQADEEQLALIEIDELLDRWGRWHRTANRLPTGGYRNAFGALQDEGAEIERKGRHAREGEAIHACALSS